MIEGKNLDRELLTVCNRTVFDLSGSAATEIVLYHKNREIKIQKVWIKYIEATSADAGVKLSIGNSSDDDAYFSTTSATSQSALSSSEFTSGDMTLATIPADTEVIIKSAGGKTGTGTAIISFSYTLN